MLGIYGGTFDPVHCGHLRAALEVQQRIGLDEVWFVPAAIPPHRDQPNTPAAVRLKLLQLALDGLAGFRADDRELKRDGPSYSFDTLQSIRAEHPDRSVCMILGQDAFLGLPGWHRWQELLDLAHIVVTDRPGHESAQHAGFERWVQSHRVDQSSALREVPAGHIYFCPIPKLDVSATHIRAALRMGQNPRFLLPDSVYDAILDQHLYPMESDA